jgi:hypothetical protein
MQLEKTGSAIFAKGNYIIYKKRKKELRENNSHLATLNVFSHCLKMAAATEISDEDAAVLQFPKGKKYSISHSISVFELPCVRLHVFS